MVAALISLLQNNLKTVLTTCVSLRTEGPSDGEIAILIGPVVAADSLVVVHTVSVCPH